MSTKTTFKRIALVAVAALGLGVMGVAPSSATSSATTLSAVVTGTAATAIGTAGNEVVAGTAINADLRVTLVTPLVDVDTFTVTWKVTNPAGTDITSDVLFAETTTAVITTGFGADLKLTRTGASYAFKETSTATSNAVFGSLTIPATSVVAGGDYTITSTVARGVTTGTVVNASTVVKVAGTQVTQGTIIGGKTGAAVTGNNARVKVFFENQTAATPYKITSTGGSILSVQAKASGTESALVGTNYDGGLMFTSAAANTATSIELNVTSLVAGDQVLTIAKQNSSTGVYTTAYTATITWGAAPAYVDSTAFLSTTTNASATADSLATARKSTAVFSSTPVARISVKQYTDAAKTIQTAGTAKAVVVTITGAGAVDTVASNGATRGTQATVAASATASTDSEFYVYSDGRAGSAAIAITVNGVAVKSYTWNFFGTATSLKQDADTSPEKSYIGVGETGTLTVFSYDASSVLVSDAPSVNATSDSATVATVSLTGTGSVTVTGVKAGKTNINICVGACATSTIKIVIPVEITAVSAASAGVTMAFDKASYEPGEKMVLTVSAVDANGRPVADGARALFSAAVTANVSFGGASVALPGTSVALADGVKTYTLYAPSSSGTVTVTGKEGADVALTEKAAGTAAGVAYVAKTITTSAVVLNSAVDAATDAANEAVDAANAATDAALAAAEAADAATTAAQEASDAVAALSESVTKLIAGLQSQIKSLAAVVAKIARKVKA